MNRFNKTNKTAMFMMLGCVLLVSGATAQFEIPWWTMDGGGGDFQGGNYSATSVIGQPDAGVLSGGAFVLQGGFLVVEAAVPTATPTPMASYDFEGTMDGWTFTPVALNTYDIQCAGATSTYDGHGIGTTTDNTTNRFGFWQAPGSIPYEANKLYKFAWRAYTSQSTPTTTPIFRFRVNESTNFSYNVEMSVTSVTGEYSPPSVGTKTYNQYVSPIRAGDLMPSFDVYDFDIADQGMVFLDQLDVYKLDIPSGTWIGETPPALGSWSWNGTISPYNPLTSGTSGGLQMSSTMSEDHGFSFWSSPLAAVAWTPNRLYCAAFYISSTDAGPFLGGVRVGSNDFNWTVRFRFYGLVAPDASGRIYPLYFETACGTHFYLVCEGMDFETTRGGTNTLTDVSVEHHDVNF